MSTDAAGPGEPAEASRARRGGAGEDGAAASHRAREGGAGFLELLRGTPHPVEPPTPQPDALPVDKIGWEGFERLIAEIAWLVDGLHTVRVYGRRGQKQDGLDLIGEHLQGRSVYQVRHKKRLTTAMLRKAVVDFAGPPRPPGTPLEDTGRPFRARRFVYATSAPVGDDSPVEKELARLNDEYAGDLRIELYHRGHLGPRLRQRPALVYGVFGRYWAEAWCGYQPPSAPTGVPPSQTLVDDPVTILGYARVLDAVIARRETEPAAAAEGFAQLAAEMRRRGFAGRAASLRRLEREALNNAGERVSAVINAVESLLDGYDDGRRHAFELGELHQANQSDPPLDEPVPLLVEVAEAVAAWAEHGIELASLVPRLWAVVEHGHPLARRLVLTIAEQVVTDEEPRGGLEGLDELIAAVSREDGGLEQVRLLCAAADLAVYRGADPAEAFDDMLRRAALGHLGEPADPIAALVSRRAGRVLAFAERRDEALAQYTRAARIAADCLLGGDALDALRCVTKLTPVGQRQAGVNAGESITSRERLLPGSDDAALSALEEMVDDDLPDALAEARRWILRERINGVVRDERIARHRCGQVLERAERFGVATLQYVLAGDAEGARRAAERLQNHIDFTHLFAAHYPDEVKTAAAAAVAASADLVPDDRVDPLGAELFEMLRHAPPAGPFASSQAVELLAAWAALADRLGQPAIDQLLPVLEPLVARSPTGYYYTDRPMITLFWALARRDDLPAVAERAQALLVGCLAHDVARAERVLVPPGPLTDAIRDQVRVLAASGLRAALEVLAAWNDSTPALLAAAREGHDWILTQPVGQPRSVFGAGGPLQHHTLLVRVAATAEPPAGHTPLATSYVDDVFEQLLRWCGDLHDSTSGRVEAVYATDILASALSDEQRARACRALLALSDEPGMNPMDTMNLASLDPLSRFRFDTGAEHFAAECLRVATACATTQHELDESQTRLFTALARGDTDPEDAQLRAHTALALDARRPVPLEGLAAHPAPTVRQVAALCWGRRAQHSDRDLKLAAELAADPEPAVRVNLAAALAELGHRGAGLPASLAATLDTLQLDPHATVRSHARGRKPSSLAELDVPVPESA